MWDHFCLSLKRGRGQKTIFKNITFCNFTMFLGLTSLHYMMNPMGMSFSLSMRTMETIFCMIWTNMNHISYNKLFLDLIVGLWPPSKLSLFWEFIVTEILEALIYNIYEDPKLRLARSSVLSVCLVY